MVAGCRWQRATSWVCTKEMIFTSASEFEYLGSAIVILNSYDILASAPGFDSFIVVTGTYGYEATDTGMVGPPFSNRSLAQTLLA